MNISEEIKKDNNIIGNCGKACPIIGIWEDMRAEKLRLTKREKISRIDQISQKNTKNYKIEIGDKININIFDTDKDVYRLSRHNGSVVKIKFNKIYISVQASKFPKTYILETKQIVENVKYNTIGIATLVHKNIQYHILKIKESKENYDDFERLLEEENRISLKKYRNKLNRIKYENYIKK